MKNQDLQTLITQQRAFFLSGGTQSITNRITYIKKLKSLIIQRKNDITAAIKADLGKSAFESYSCEILMVLQECTDTIKHIRQWSRTRTHSAGLFTFPSRASIIRDPHGVVLVMSPWNYPFNLTMTPVISALAAGNTVIVKPSNYSPATSRIIQELLESVYPPEYAAVVQGGREANTALLSHAFDYIFFTGSPSVGKIVMQKAAENLTPITLELGGKSPCIVDDTADIPAAARKIVWGKLLNAGQTCIAPDYLFVQDTIKDRLITAIQKEIETRYGDTLQNDTYPHIISRRHFDRAVSLIEHTKKQTNTAAIYGGNSNADTLTIEPTIIADADWNDEIMQEELFCPILPVLTWKKREELFDKLQTRARPLALYIFSRDTHFARTLCTRLPFGGGCINDVVVHITARRCPFGGTGSSGMGCYHGKYSFMTFTREKTILTAPPAFDIPLRYAPFGEKKYRFISRLFK